MLLNVLAFGASRNIGYFAALYLLDEGHKVTFLLRRKTTFDEDARMQGFIKSGQAKLVFGDATSTDDVKEAWDTAAQEGNLDYLICTVGAKPVFSLTKGIQVDNPLICSSTVRAILSVLSSRSSEIQQPIPTKLVIVTSNGVTSKSHKDLPLTLKPFYSLFLSGAHKDKRAAEHLLARSSNSDSFACSAKEIATLEKSGHLSPNEQDTDLPSVPLEVLAIRPSLLTDGEARAESKKSGSGEVGFRTGAELPNAYTVSRKDVAWFIAKMALVDWNSWKGKAITISY